MNPVTNSRAVRAKVEAVVAAFLRNFYDARGEDPAFDKRKLDVLCRRPGTPLDGLRVYEGQTPLDFAMPCLVVNVVRATRLVADESTPWSEVPVEIHVMDQMEEDNEGTEEGGEEDQTAKNDAARLHAERVGFVTALMDEENQVMTRLNKPQSGPDTRPIKSFSIFGYWYEDEQAQQFDLHWDDTFVYTLHCSPFDSIAATTGSSGGSLGQGNM